MGSKKDFLLYSSLILILFSLILGTLSTRQQQNHIEVLEEELIYTQAELQGIRNTLSLIEANNDAELYIGEQEAEDDQD